MIDPAAVRAVTERLVAIKSVSPDPIAETRCARVLTECLPPGVEHGEWRAPDGRPIVWALSPGRSPRTVVLLGHYDTVSISDYAALDPARGDEVALDPEAVRSRLLERMREPATLPPAVVADLEEEARHPGTWMLGRGALDMKSGLAAAIAALGVLVQEPPNGGVLFIATPDEEHQSAGMLAAVPELERFRNARGLELVGALNLDYSLEPAMYVGAVGKLEVGCYALGHAGHVGDPTRGVDAIQMIASLVSSVTRAPELIEDDGVAPAALSMRDLKSGYSIEAAREAVAEFSVIGRGRSVTQTLEVFREVATRALAELASASRAAPRARTATVLTYSELTRRGGDGTEPGPASDEADARAATLERLRVACRVVRLEAPALVLHLLPPFYPFAAPGNGPLVEAARRVAVEEELPFRTLYPFISDISYLAWRDAEAEVAREFPSLGREYRLPFAASRALALDVVNLGPWGRDAHTRDERVHAPYAFERLPGLIERVVRAALER